MQNKKARSPFLPAPTPSAAHLCFVSVSSHVTPFSLNVDPKCGPVSCFLLKPFVLGVALVRVYSLENVLFVYLCLYTVCDHTCMCVPRCPSHCQRTSRVNSPFLFHRTLRLPVLRLGSKPPQSHLAGPLVASIRIEDTTGMEA